MSYITKYLSEVAEIIERLDTTAIERMVKLIIDARARGGRLFILGVGGGGRDMPHMRCATSARLLVWRPMPRVITFPSSLRA